MKLSNSASSFAMHRVLFAVSMAGMVAANAVFADSVVSRPDTGDASSAAECRSCSAIRMVSPVGIPSRGVVLGVREDPLNAYDKLLSRAYPDGIPLSETATALDVGRAGARAAAGTVFSQGPKVNRSAPLPEAANRSRTLRAISVNAVPVSPRGGADWDYLRVSVAGVDDRGEAMPVHGTIQATLLGVSEGNLQPKATRFAFDASSSQRPFASLTPHSVKRIAFWSQRLDAGLPESFLFPLPNMAGPNRRLASVGALHVQLAVPGRGVFEAVQDGIVLRRHGVVRDSNRIATGSGRLFIESGGVRSIRGTRPFVP